MADIDATRQRLLAAEEFEDVMKPNPMKFVMFPIKFNDIWEMYKRIEMNFWTAEDIDYSEDEELMGKKEEKLKKSIQTVAAYNAMADGNIFGMFSILSSDVTLRVSSPEARAFLGFQVAFENIHCEAQNHLMQAVIADETERSKFCSDMLKMPTAIAKAKFLKVHTGTDVPMAEQFVTIAAFKIVFSSSSALLRQWLHAHKSDESVYLPALDKTYGQILKDVRLHGEFAGLLHRNLKEQLPTEMAHGLIRQAIRLEKEFLIAAIDIGIFQANEQSIEKYLEYLADDVLSLVGFPRLFNVQCPFKWAIMAMSEEDAVRNERLSAEKQLEKQREASQAAASNPVFSLDEDF